MVLLASLNAETFPPNIAANLGNGREEKQQKAVVSGRSRGSVGSQRDGIAAFPRWLGYQIHIGSYAVHYTVPSSDDRLHPREAKWQPLPDISALESHVG